MGKINDIKKKKICINCIDEQQLKKEIFHHSQKSTCSYCNNIAESISIVNIADRVELAFEQHFRRTPDQPNDWQYSLLSDKDYEYNWERDGYPVIYAIANAAQIPEEAAADIQEILDEKHGDHESSKMGEETEFCSDSYYEEKNTNDHSWQFEWECFEFSLKTEARFFSRSAERLLTKIFNSIDKMSTSDGRPLIVDAGPLTAMTTLFRARAFQSHEKLKEALCYPDIHIGSPPAALAAAGRMNAKGISVFYGATDPSVAIAEVRPPVGSNVVVACFEIVRPLRLLDLTAFDKVTEKGSFFDPGWHSRLERATFLRSLSQRITKPIMPDDEAFEYIPTQAIADFLATENTPTLDGIIFPSVQAAGDGLNVVLFYKAAGVEAIDIPDDTEIKANIDHSSYDSVDFGYTVTETFSPSKSPEEIEREINWGYSFAPSFANNDTSDKSPRQVSLRIQKDSLTIHAVRKINIKYNTCNVRRYRREK